MMLEEGVGETTDGNHQCEDGRVRDEEKETEEVDA